MKALKVGVLLLVLTSIPASAQIESDKCLDQSVPLTVVSLDRSRLPDIGPGTFHGTYDGKPIRINSVSVDRQPRRVLLLLQTSGRFETVPDWPKAVALDLLEGIPVPSEVGLATFSETLNTLLGPTADREKVRKDIEAVYPARNTKVKSTGESTHLWDAIDGSMKFLGPQRIGDVVFVVTDGTDDHSKRSQDEAIHTLLAWRVRLYFAQLMGSPSVRIMFHPGGNPFALPTMSGESPQGVLQAAIQTGGLGIGTSYFDEDVEVRKRHPSWMQKAMEMRSREILGFFRVDLQLPEPANTEGAWSLSINSPDRDVDKHFRLYYPRTILRCGSDGK